MCQRASFIESMRSILGAGFQKDKAQRAVQLSDCPQVFPKNFSGSRGIYLHIPLLHWQPKHSSFQHDMELANSLSSTLNGTETVNQNNACTQAVNLEIVLMPL